MSSAEGFEMATCLLACQSRVARNLFDPRIHGACGFDHDLMIGELFDLANGHGDLDY